MNKTNIIGAIAVIAFLGVIFLGATRSTVMSPIGGDSSAPTLGAAPGGSAGAGTASPIASYIYPNPTNLDYVRLNALEADGQFLLGGYTAATAIDTVPSIVNCITSSSTIFSIANPYAATSTFTVNSFVGTQNSATTSDVVIATSTVASPPFTTSTATSSLHENIFGAQIAAGAQFFSNPGISIGPGTGYLNPSLNGFVSTRTFAVGPNEFVIGFSTSTGNGSGAGSRTVGLIAVPASCTIKGEWKL